jgi:Protein of unknown function (DUF2750)
MKITAKEVEAVIKLPGEKRYAYFIKRAADQNQVWGLWNEGWAMGRTDDGIRTIPIWPAREYAELCRTGHWNEFQSKATTLRELMRQMLPDLASEGIRVSIFHTPNEASVLVSDEDLISSLEVELSKIE